MSVAIYIACESEPDGEDTFVSGKALGHVDPDTLAGIENKLGCTSVYDLMSVNPDDIAEFVEDLDESQIGAEEWYPPAEGLRTVRMLRDYIQGSPSSVPNWKDVIEDLTECERVLQLLEARGIGFHFAIDY